SPKPAERTIAGDPLQPCRGKDHRSTWATVVHVVW
ncbi:hypothetical protein V3C99_015920, partial [Haemonchus contortus]